MRTLALSLLTIAVLPAGRHAMAADSAAALIEAVSRAAGDAVTWEAEGRLVTQDSADDAGPRTEASFRIVIMRTPTERARIEITGVPAPLVRVCDGSVQWGYQPAAKQFWTVTYPRIEACAEPFYEWPYLAAELREPEIVGQEQLRAGEKVIDCTVVRGDYVGPDARRSGRRVIWIEDATKTIWQYRVERGAAGIANLAEPAVRIYSLLAQARDGLRRPGDFVLQVPDESQKLSRPPVLRLGDGAPIPHAGADGVFKAGNGVTAPAVIFRSNPAYTAEARHSHVEGTVVLFVEVGTDGAAHNIKVIHSLDPGLDQKAIDAVSEWKFRPGMRDGVPVTVAATIQINFRLMDKKPQ